MGRRFSSGSRTRAGGCWYWACRPRIRPSRYRACWSRDSTRPCRRRRTRPRPAIRTCIGASPIESGRGCDRRSTRARPAATFTSEPSTPCSIESCERSASLSSRYGRSLRTRADIPIWWSSSSRRATPSGITTGAITTRPRRVTMPRQIASGEAPWSRSTRSSTKRAGRSVGKSERTLSASSSRTTAWAARRAASCI